MLTTIPAMLIAALVPLLIGFLWYNKKTFGRAWSRSAGVQMDDGKKTNILLIFGLTYIFSLMITVILPALVIHQQHIYSVLMGEQDFGQQGSATQLYLEDFMNRYGDRFRTFRHGMLHGAISGLFFATPILAINALFERKGFKYIALNAGYWIITLMFMGGILCAMQP